MPDIGVIMARLLPPKTSALTGTGAEPVKLAAPAPGSVMVRLCMFHYRWL